MEHVAGALEKSPNMNEYENYKKENQRLKLAHHKTIAHHFDGWNNAKRKIGLDTYKKYRDIYTKEYIVKCLNYVADEIGISPGIEDYKQFKENEESQMKLPGLSTISNRFGSWNKAKEKAGLITNLKKNKNYNKEMLIGCLEHVAGALEKSPTLIEYEKYKRENPELNFPSKDTMVQYGWNKLKKEVGLETFLDSKSIHKKFDDFELNDYLIEIIKIFDGNLPKKEEYIEYKHNFEKELPMWEDLIDFWIKKQKDENIWMSKFFG